MTSVDSHPSSHPSSLPSSPSSHPSVASVPPGRLDGATADADPALRAARDNMIERQIRAWEVLDERVLDLYREIPRADFFSPERRALAYADRALPLGCGQFALEPKQEARMLQEMQLRGDERVLHVGTGSGFFAALLARLCREVVSVEIVPELAAAARARLAAHGAANVAVEIGDAARGWPAAGECDAVVLTGSAPLMADGLRAQARPGGFILAVVGAAPAMTLQRLDKTSSGRFVVRDILETVIPPLQNAPAPERFKF